jgi:hypothetical protein
MDTLVLDGANILRVLLSAENSTKRQAIVTSTAFFKCWRTAPDRAGSRVALTDSMVVDICSYADRVWTDSAKRLPS